MQCLILEGSVMLKSRSVVLIKWAISNEFVDFRLTFSIGRAKISIVLPADSFAARLAELCLLCLCSKACSALLWSSLDF